MSDSEFNKQQSQAAIYRRQKRAKKVPCPEGVEEEAHRNRWRVSAKLTRNNFHSFKTWREEKQFNVNYALNYLIHTHPDLKDHV